MRVTTGNQNQRDGNNPASTYGCFPGQQHFFAMLEKQALQNLEEIKKKNSTTQPKMLETVGAILKSVGFGAQEIQSNMKRLREYLQHNENELMESPLRQSTQSQLESEREYARILQETETVFQKLDEMKILTKDRFNKLFQNENFVSKKISAIAVLSGAANIILDEKCIDDVLSHQNPVPFANALRKASASLITKLSEKNILQAQDFYEKILRHKHPTDFVESLILLDSAGLLTAENCIAIEHMMMANAHISRHMNQYQTNRMLTQEIVSYALYPAPLHHVAAYDHEIHEFFRDQWPSVVGQIHRAGIPPISTTSGDPYTLLAKMFRILLNHALRNCVQLVLDILETANALSQTTQVCEDIKALFQRDSFRLLADNFFGDRYNWYRLTKEKQLEAIQDIQKTLKDLQEKYTSQNMVGLKK